MTGYKPETQNRWELDRFLDFIRNQKINLYMEIGLYSGSTFKEVYDTLLRVHNGDHTKFKMIGVDLPTNADAFAACSRVVEAIPNASVYWTSSTDPDTVEKIYEELAEFSTQPEVASLIFIDGDHSFAQAKDDYMAYNPMFQFVAFNDIDPRTVEQNKRKHGGRDIATVYHLYEGLRIHSEETTICDASAEKARGIGILGYGNNV
jgi:hypothetical protein